MNTTTAAAECDKKNMYKRKKTRDDSNSKEQADAAKTRREIFCARAIVLEEEPSTLP